MHIATQKLGHHWLRFGLLAVWNPIVIQYWNIINVNIQKIKLRKFCQRLTVSVLKYWWIYHVHLVEEFNELTPVVLVMCINRVIFVNNICRCSGAFWHQIISRHIVDFIFNNHIWYMFLNISIHYPEWNSHILRAQMAAEILPSFIAHQGLIWWMHIRADSRLAPSQWETSLQSNTISHWLVANLESALHMVWWQMQVGYWWHGGTINSHPAWQTDPISQRHSTGPSHGIMTMCVQPKCIHQVASMTGLPL